MDIIDNSSGTVILPSARDCRAHLRIAAVIAIASVMMSDGSCISVVCYAVLACTSASTIRLILSILRGSRLGYRGPRSTLAIACRYGSKPFP